MALALWRKPQPQRRGPLEPNDIDALARFVEGVDSTRYFDYQEQEARAAAAKRWPVLAGVLGVSVPDADR